MRISPFVFLLLVPVVLFSCIGEDEEIAAPKPRGYFRIDMPEKTYKRYDTTCPYTFEHPWYSVMITPKEGPAESCWKNLEFPGFKATIHISYKQVHNNLDTLLDNVWELTEKHSSVAAGLRDSTIRNSNDKVYGMVFELAGNAASQMQFYLTDSTDHFLRGALYFFAEPNKDSIAPVYDFIREDVYHLISTFRWKDKPAAQ
ncbi:MAG: gliding motility proteinGldD [Bacteroidetes bacterium]|nr:MAG: gliding motility proteinGldD [Bacteroidota bacterium]